MFHEMLSDTRWSERAMFQEMLSDTRSRCCAHGTQTIKILPHFRSSVVLTHERVT